MRTDLKPVLMLDDQQETVDWGQRLYKNDHCWKTDFFSTFGLQYGNTDIHQDSFEGQYTNWNPWDQRHLLLYMDHQLFHHQLPLWLHQLLAQIARTQKGIQHYEVSREQTGDMLLEQSILEREFHIRWKSKENDFICNKTI